MSRSVPALRQAMARMLFDPAFVDRVRRGPVEGLSEPERTLLLSVDPRAWGTDRYRRSRAVHALLDEYPVTAAVLGLAGVDAFFSSEAFARTLADRGSLALDFGAWAAQDAGPVARLEAAIARARRAEARDGTGLAARPGLEPITLPGGVLAFYLDQRKRLGADPVAALAKRRRGRRPPRPRGAPEPLLVERDARGEVQLGGASAALVALLAAAIPARPRRALAEVALELGCEPGEDTALIDDLLADGLLVRVAAPAPQAPTG